METFAPHLINHQRYFLLLWPSKWFHKFTEISLIQNIFKFSVKTLKAFFISAEDRNSHESKGAETGNMQEFLWLGLLQCLSVMWLTSACGKA